MNTVQETCYMRQQSLQLTIFMLTFDFPNDLSAESAPSTRNNSRKKQNDHKIIKNSYTLTYLLNDVSWSIDPETLRKNKNENN